jgi:predicted ATPase/DNA-binding SARP family transcriptional activator
MPRLVISMLGSFGVTLDGRPATGFVSSKVRALLAYLAVETDRSHSRDAIAELLWPKQPGQSARNSLRQALANLRHVIADHSASPPFLTVSKNYIQLNSASDLWLDVAHFKRLLIPCERHLHGSATSCAACVERMHSAIDLYRGPFLDQFWAVDSAPFEDWATALSEQYHRLAIETLQRLVAYHEQHSSFADAVAYARRQIALDPCHESAHRSLMRLLAGSGQRNAALVQYHSCRRVLEQELGVEPDEETTALYDQIRNVTTASKPLPAPTAALTPAPTTAGSAREIPAKTTSLPATTNSFIGRKQELVLLTNLLQQSDIRLITLTGPAGVGKTRLALQAAQTLQSSFPDGVVFAELAPISDPALIRAHLAYVLGVHKLGQALDEPLALRLTARKALLVLDNFEQVAAAAPVVSELLSMAPQITVLVTSRVPLHVYGEYELVVKPLSLPDFKYSPPVGQLLSIDAVQLFVQRARAAHASFEMTEANVRTVVEICQRVDGLPLAIELAAARSKIFSLPALLKRLDHRLALLTSGPRNLPERQQTLRAAIAWSHALLSEAEQRMFARLSVFVGGGRQEAVMDMCTSDGESAEQVLDVLASLIDKSLLNSVADADGEPRFLMLETIREFAAEQLEGRGETALLRSRHAQYYGDLSEAARQGIKSADQVFWLHRAEQEYNNLRAMLEWTIGQQQGELALKRCTALANFWYFYGYSKEGLSWLERALALDPPVSTKQRARALQDAAILTSLLGNYERAIQLGQESLALYRVEGDEASMSQALNNLGVIAQEQGQYAEAQAYHEASLELKRRQNKRQSMATSLINLGATAYFREQPAIAQRYTQEGMALAEEVGDTSLMITGLNILGWTALGQEQWATAARCFRQALQLCREFGNHHALPDLIVGAAGVACSKQQWIKAGQLLGAADVQRARAGQTWSVSRRRSYELVASMLHAGVAAGSVADLCQAGRSLSLEQVLEIALS